MNGLHDKILTRTTYAIITVGIILPILIIGNTFPQSFASDNDLGTLTIDVRYTNGDRVVSSGTMLKIYQGSSDKVFSELTKDSLTPSFTVELPLNHRYQVEAYIDDIYAGVNYVEFTKKTSHTVINIPTSGGLLLEILYNDGKPISGAEVLIKSPTGKRLGSYITDINGDTPRRWLPPTILDGDYYLVEVSLGEKILYEYSPVHLFPSKKQDLTITTPWPSTIDSVVVQAHIDPADSNSNVDWKQEDLTAVLYDSKGDKIAQSVVSPRGDARFSSLLAGVYELHIIQHLDRDEEKKIITEHLMLDKQGQSIYIFGVKIYPNTKDSTKDISTNTINDTAIQNETVPHTINDSDDTSDVDSVVPKLSCNCVAFRFDDVQNFWLNDVQIKVFDTLHQKDVPVTLGIIGNHFGKDEKLVNAIAELIQADADIEIANHGWEHEDFAVYQKEEQSDLLKKSNQALFETIGVSPTVFIPPLNSFNNDTLLAMSENGIKYFSTEIDESDVVYQILGFSIYHFPEGATTGELNKDISLFEGLSHQETFSDIQTSIANYGFAVVTMHPQEFSTIKDGTYSNTINQNQIEELKLLIDTINKHNIDTVLISNINEKSSVIKNDNSIPQWVKNNARWWADKQITDAEFSEGLEYLIEINIIKIPDAVSIRTDVSEKHIPEWIRNNASWWSEGTLSDDEFTKSIQYMISQRIIQI